MDMKVLVIQLCPTLHIPRLLCSWNSPGKSTGVGSHSLLRGTLGTTTRPHLSFLENTGCLVFPSCLCFILFPFFFLLACKCPVIIRNFNPSGLMNLVPFTFSEITKQRPWSSCYSSFPLWGGTPISTQSLASTPLWPLSEPEPSPVTSTVCHVRST